LASCSHPAPDSVFDRAVDNGDFQTFRVVDMESGEPVAGAEVTTISFPSTGGKGFPTTFFFYPPGVFGADREDAFARFAYHAISDENGLVQLPQGIDDGVAVKGSSRGWLALSFEDPSEASVTPEIPVLETKAIPVTVLDRQGRGIAGVRVGLIAEHSSWAQPIAFTDEEGQALFAPFTDQFLMAGSGSWQAVLPTIGGPAPNQDLLVEEQIPKELRFEATRGKTLQFHFRTADGGAITMPLTVTIQDQTPGSGDLLFPGACSRGEYSFPCAMPGARFYLEISSSSSSLTFLHAQLLDVPQDATPETEYTITLDLDHQRRSWTLSTVTIAPSTVLNLAAMGLENVLLGVSDYAPNLPDFHASKVGGLHNPNLEKITFLDPELVIIQGNSPILPGFWDESGIELKEFHTDTIAQWKEEVRWLGEHFLRPKQAERLIADVEQQFAKVIAAREAAGNPAPLRVLLVASRRPGEAAGILAVGPGGFLDELLTIAGGSNVLADAPRAYIDLAEEALLRLDPEVIIELRSPDPDPLATWKRDFPSLTAVQNNKVLALEGEDLLMPGPGMGKEAAAIAGLLSE